MILINPYNNKHIGRHLLTRKLLFIACLSLFFIMAVQSASADYVRTDNVLFYDWSNDGLTDSVIYDISGNGNHGQKSGATVREDLASGAYSRYFDSSGTAYVSANDGVPNLSSSISIELIFNVTDTTGTNDLIDSLDYPNGENFRVQCNNGKLRAWVGLGAVTGCVNFDSDFTIESGKWYHAVFTYDGTDGKWYVNSTLDKTINNPGTYTFGANTLFIGNDNGGTLKPRIALVRLYANKALSQAEVTQNYNNDMWRVNSTSYVAKKIVVMGDSIAWGVTTGLSGAARTWPLILNSHLPDRMVINYGISGGASANLIDVWQQDVTNVHPQFVIIAIGINDKNTPPTTYYNNVYTMCEWALSNGTVPILCSITPANGDPFSLAYNANLSAYATANKIPYINFYPVVNDPDNPNHLKAEYAADEGGIHLNQAGYTAMGESIDTGIFNDEANTFTISTSSTTVQESDTTITLTITKSASSSYGYANISTSDGTATAPSDYTAITSTRIGFIPGEDKQTIALSIKDNVNDTSAIKYFYVVLSNPSGNASLGVPNNITINIITPAATVTPTPKPYNTHAPGNWLIEFAENLKYLIPCVLIGAIIWFYYSELNNKGRRRR